jgi:hypothetical protein
LTSQARLGQQAGLSQQAGGFQALGPGALFKALGLPAERLSASIVSFAKFFSLQLEPGLLVKIRGQASWASQPQQPTGGLPAESAPLKAVAVLKAKEAFALAALAATDKGLELTQAGLEEYATAIDPDRQGGRQGEDSSANRKNDPGRQEPADSEESPDEEALMADEILKAAEASPALNLLNWLPGKNGQRWLAFPFSFTQKGKQFRASLRILLDEGSAGGKPFAGRMSLDIAETAEAGKRLSFTLNMNKQGQADLKVLVHPPRRPRSLKILSGQLSRFMEMPPDRVFVENCDVPLPFAPDCRA